MIKRFKKNTKGTDYVVGDIHGCFSLLESKLLSLGFNEAEDRLFSVGDLIDRGKESHRCIEFLKKPWFHAVRGNHEQMLIDAVEDRGMSYCLLQNGGEWFFDLMPQQQSAYALILDGLPLAIEIESDCSLVGVIHAEVPYSDWDRFKNSLTSKTVEATAIWARSKINDMDEQQVVGISRVYVGHTPTKGVVQLGNVNYIDTGAVHTGNLTVLAINYDET